MTNTHAIGLASKGILNNTLTSKGILIYYYNEYIIPIKKSNNTLEGYKEDVVYKKKIKLKFKYDNKYYKFTKIVDKNFNVKLYNIDIEIINKKIIVNFIEK